MATPGDTTPGTPVVIPHFKKKIADPSLPVTQPYRAQALAATDFRERLSARQASIDTTRARAFIYRFLAKAFDLPRPKDWQWLSNSTVQSVFCSAVRHIAPDEESVLRKLARQLVDQLHPGQFEPFVEDYMGIFDMQNRGKVGPASETSGLRALVSSFGLQLSGDLNRRQDPLCTALELMAWLATKEAYALEELGDDQQADFYSSAQKKLLKAHLGVWAPDYCRQVVQVVESGVLALLANFTQSFLETERKNPRLILGGHTPKARAVVENS